MGRHKASTSSGWLSAFIVAVGAITAWAINWLQPFQTRVHTPVTSAAPTSTTSVPSTPRATAPTPRPTASSTPSLTASPTTPVSTPSSSPVRTCLAGRPVRVEWESPGISVNAEVEHVGLDGDGNLAAPESKHTIGWYSPGPQPGSGRGNVLIDGHTYTDNSAVFKEDFAAVIRRGMVVSLVMDNGSTCSYQITKVWPNIQKKGEYPQYVAREGFYDFEGPEQLLGVTCSGSWNAIARSHEAVTAFMATPIN